MIKAKTGEAAGITERDFQVGSKYILLRVLPAAVLKLVSESALP